MTISVTTTATPSWPGQGRRATVVLSGDLHGRDWPTIARAIAETHDTGVDVIVLDIRAVHSCDRQALFELVAVRGRWPTSHRCTVDVVGARAAQFLDAMAREPITQLHDLQVVIGELRRPRIVSPPRVAAPEPDRSGDDGESPATEGTEGRGTAVPSSSGGHGGHPARTSEPEIHLRQGRHRR